MKKFLIRASLVLIVPWLKAQTPVETSPPQGVTISVYDLGLGLVNEARRVALEPGENTIILRGLPRHLDAASLSFATVTRNAPFELLDQVVEFDLNDVQTVLHRMTGQPVMFSSAGSAREGILLGGLMAAENGAPVFPVGSRAGEQLWMVGLDDISSVVFPKSGDLLALEPQARWRVRARETGPQNFRLTYRTDGLSWRAHYEVMLAPAALQADFSARMELVNESGTRYDGARVRLLSTEKGLAEPILPGTRRTEISTESPAQRYAYGASEPAFERTVASLAPTQVYELPQTVNLASDRSTFVQFLQAAGVPIKKFYVYDGVRFDRFQRKVRSDWNYGTEFHDTVHMHVEFENEKKFGLGENLPPGMCRLYQVRADGMVDLVGEEPMLATPVGANITVRVGPAAGLRGERERTGYTEINPHRIYEESFQIRLANSSDEKAEVRVVEHLYRGSDFEIVSSDADHTRTGPQTIEFAVSLEPAIRKSISYTVRYTW